MQWKGKTEVEVFEEKANELVSMTFALCEKRLSKEPNAVSLPQKALAAAALSVQESVKTFLAVTNIPDDTGEQEK
ncbi:hypothetical protein [Desulfovibrio aminophilus]|uniref:hypothetical protein n=1 Tax=Desulfovibrio aminophilus TaxID=81425 RepID=UPI0033968E69